MKTTGFLTALVIAAATLPAQAPSKSATPPGKTPAKGTVLTVKTTGFEEASITIRPPAPRC